jgi:hypothetical protein
VLETSVQVIGEREPGRAHDRWVADRQALERVVKLAIDWCLQARPDRAVTLQSGATPAVFIRRADSAVERTRAVLYTDYLTTVRSIGEDRHRAVAIAPGYGRVTVVEGGRWLDRVGWRPTTVEAMTDFLKAVSAEVVYGRIRRTDQLSEAEFPEAFKSLPLVRTNLDAIAHQDHLAIDIHAIQLLGPGYRGRIPSVPGWRVTELTHSSTLLEHPNPRAWLRQITLEEAMDRKSVPDVELVNEARTKSYSPKAHITDRQPSPPERPDEWPKGIDHRTLCRVPQATSAQAR